MVTIKKKKVIDVKDVTGMQAEIATAKQVFDPGSDNRSTEIEWTNHTWNPFVGCNVHTKGCTNCYAMRQAVYIAKTTPNARHYQGVAKEVNGNPVWTGVINQAPPHILQKPLKVKVPSMFFVNSMSDFFHQNVAYKFQADAMAIMLRCPQHIFQILTKRPENIAKFFKQWGPCPGNVWLGATVESNEYLHRIEQLTATPAPVHFLSLEPLVGPMAGLADHLNGVEWVILGGESGPHARAMDYHWVIQARDEVLKMQQLGFDVALFMKQYGMPRNNPLWKKAEALGVAPLNYVKEHDPVGKGGSLIEGVSYKEFPGAQYG